MLCITILTVLGALIYIAARSSSASIGVSTTQAHVQNEARNVLHAIRQEIQLAAKQPNSSLTPPLNTIQILENPSDNCALEVRFQIPQDHSGDTWSEPIRFRHLMEGDVLSGAGRGRVVRVERVNGVEQETLVAGANRIAELSVVRDGHVLTISVTAVQSIGPTNGATIRATTRGRVYLVN